MSILKLEKIAFKQTKSIHASYSEILRAIDSLQLTDRLKVVATPANWTVSIFFDRRKTNEIRLNNSF